jgi:hypothetical protein
LPFTASDFQIPDAVGPCVGLTSLDFAGINNGKTFKRPGYDLARLYENQAKY